MKCQCQKEAQRGREDGYIAVRGKKVKKGNHRKESVEPVITFFFKDVLKQYIGTYLSFYRMSMNIETDV